MPKKSDEKLDELNPSAYALQVAGRPKEGESEEKMNERAEVYKAAKRRRRWEE